MQIEIPLADTWVDALAVADVARATGLTCMVGHTRRFNPSHQWVHQRVMADDLTLQHMDVQTFFFRRTIINALGQPRSWVDNLLWHHVAHTIDLFAYQAGERIKNANIMARPLDAGLHIPMDMSIQLRSESGKLCTLALRFDNEGPLGTFFVTSATKAPTSRATTISSPVRTNASTSPWTASNSRIANLCRRFSRAVPPISPSTQ